METTEQSDMFLASVILINHGSSIPWTSFKTKCSELAARELRFTSIMALPAPYQY